MENKDLFLKIINHELPATILYEDDKVIAILDKFPHQKGHFLVIPKIYSRNLFEIDDQTLAYAMIKARELALEQVKLLGAKGFKLLVNNESVANQQIFHTHIHIIPFY